MKFIYPRKEFLAFFNHMSAFASTRDVRPILQNVKATVNDSGILLTATDGEVSARGVLPPSDGFTLLSPGEALLPAKLLKRVLLESTADEVTFEYENNCLRVKCGRGKFQLDTADDLASFPSISEFTEQTFFKIPAKSLHEIINRTTFATDASSSHYDLRGVKFVFCADRVDAIATDGRRLAHQCCAVELCGVGAEDSEYKQEAIFPPRALNLIADAANASYEVLIAFRNQQAIIKAGNIVISTNLLTGRFPDWRTIVPDRSVKKRVDFLVGDLESALRQAEIVATADKPGVWFNFTEGNVDIAAAGESTGESSVVMAVAYDGEEHKLRLDPQFVKDFLRRIPDEETVAFYFFGDFRTLFETSDGYQYVVMQMA